MEQAAALPLPYPEAAVVAEESLDAQTLAVASELPERPLVLGGCCCAHVGAVEGLAVRHGRVAVVWVDAHGDLNTPESSPSGNAWGMPLRMLVDSDAVRAEDVVLVGARALDPPEEDFLRTSRMHRGAENVAKALDRAAGAYVALDCDALSSKDIASFMPEPGGLRLAEVEDLLRDVVARAPLLGAGLSGLAPDARNVSSLSRLCRSLGL